MAKPKVGRPRKTKGDREDINIRLGSKDELALALRRLTRAAQAENASTTRVDVARECLLEGAKRRLARQSLHK